MVIGPLPGMATNTVCLNEVKKLNEFSSNLHTLWCLVEGPEVLFYNGFSSVKRLASPVFHPDFQLFLHWYIYGECHFY